MFWYKSRVQRVSVLKKENRKTSSFYGYYFCQIDYNSKNKDRILKGYLKTEEIEVV